MHASSPVELAVPTRAGITGPVRGPDPARLRRGVGIAVVAAVVGVAAARFFAPDHPAPVPRPEATSLAPPAQVAALERKVGDHPDNVSAWQQLGVAYTRDAIRTADPSLYGAATTAFDRADALEPGAADTLVGRGVLSLTLHRFDEALTLGEQAHRANPFDPDALAVMVDASVETGRYDAAATDLQALLDLRPGLAAFSRVSYLRELNGDVTGASEALSQAETAGSGATFDLASVISLEGDLAFNHGDLAGALRQYDRALALSPDVVLARIGRARVLAARGRLDDAIADLVELTERYPVATAVSLLGDLQAAAGRTHDAARSYDLVRTISTLQQASGAVTDLEMAVFEADHGGRAAITLATAAYAARPTIYGADALAWALRQGGRSAEAVPYVEEALRLSTHDALLHFHAAAVYADVGADERARAELTVAFTVNPWFSFLHRADAADLAARLGVATPDEWRSPS